MKLHLAIFACLALAACSEPLTPSTPPLLQGAKEFRAGDQWIGQCPEHAARGLGPPVTGSEEIDARLKAQFPPGSEAARLAEALRGQGFVLEGPCLGDRSILQAWFRQSGGGWFGPYPAVASVNFKVDPEGRVVWAYGRIGFVKM